MAKYNPMQATGTIENHDGWDRIETETRSMSIKVDIHDVDLMTSDIVRGQDVMFTNGQVREFDVVTEYTVKHRRKPNGITR